MGPSGYSSGLAPLRQLPIMSATRTVGRYELHDEFASGGMASVHLGRLLGAAGFVKVVAIKRLHAQFADDVDLVSRLLEEARLSERIRHPNVVATLDVVAEERELLLVMEYVHGETLARLARAAREAGATCPPEIVARIGHDVLSGLAAAHGARGADGQPLTIVHRDISPQNILVGADGVTRLLDFGIAKAMGSIGHTREGHLKGKVPYMAPELLRYEPATPVTDLWAVGVVLWELRCGRRLFRADTEMEAMGRVIMGTIPDPGSLAEGVSPVDDVILKALNRDEVARFQDAASMAEELERAVRLATPAEVAAWVETLAGPALREKQERVRAVEQARSLVPASDATPVAHTRDREPESATPRRGALVAIFALATLVAGGAWFSMRQRPVPSVAEPVAPSLSAAVPSAAPSSATPQTAGEGGELDASAASESDASAVAAFGVDAGKSVVVRGGGRRGAARGDAGPAISTSATPVPATTPDCDPPYSVDAMGRKRFKLECVGK